MSNNTKIRRVDFKAKILTNLLNNVVSSLAAQKFYKNLQLQLLVHSGQEHYSYIKKMKQFNNTIVGNQKIYWHSNE